MFPLQAYIACAYSMRITCAHQEFHGIAQDFKCSAFAYKEQLPPWDKPIAALRQLGRIQAVQL
jgi:hypothetical protein